MESKLENGALPAPPISRQELDERIKEAYAQAKTFPEIVKTAMLVRNWLMSVQPDEEQKANGSFYDPGPLGLHPPSKAPPVEQQQPAGELEPVTVIGKAKAQLIAWFNFSIDPSGSPFYYWTIAVTMGCIYNLLTIVIFVFDDIHMLYYSQWLCSNFSFDGIFLLDILVRSRLTFMLDGAEVTDIKHLWRNYKKSPMFVLDVVAILPTDLAFFVRYDISLVRINRLLKSYRVYDFVRRTEMRTSWPNGFRVVVLITACFLLFHWNSCAYFMLCLLRGIDDAKIDDWIYTPLKNNDPVLPTCEASDPDCHFDETGLNISNREDYVEEMMHYWMNKTVVLAFTNFSREYSNSFYWSSLILTNRGQQNKPQLIEQYCLEIFDTMIGLLVLATIIGSVGNVVSAMNQAQSKYQQIKDGVKFYMKYRNVNSDIQKRVVDCLEYIWSQGQITEENELLHTLPTRLQGQLAVHLHMDTLKKVDLLREMYIVKRGKLNMVSEVEDTDESILLATLEEGAVFGELSILNLTGHSNRRAVALQSLGYSDVYILKRDDVSQVLQEYPEQRKLLIERAREMLESDGMIIHDEEIVMEETGMLTLEEQLKSLSGCIETLDRQLTAFCEQCHTGNAQMKQRVTHLEQIYHRNRHRIRTDIAQGRLKPFIREDG